MFYVECDTCGVVQDETPEVESALLAAKIHAKKETDFSHGAGGTGHTVKVWSLIKVLVALGAVCVSLWAGPAQARIHVYEYEDVVVGADQGPVTLTGKGSVQVRITLPPGVEGTMLAPYLKSCEIFGPEFAPIVIDEDIIFTTLKRHPDVGTVVVLIGDRKPGRTQVYCPRLPYIPREED